MKILVTGATGMLGREVAQALAARGDRVTVMQRRPSGLGLPEVLGDVADHAAVSRATADVDAVIHLAARVGVVGTWAEFARTNIAGTQTIVAAALAGPAARLVMVSSPSVAHAGQSLVGAGAGPADPQAARGHYSRSKAAAEQLALRADGDDLSVVAVRPHLVWGPGDEQLVGRIVQRARAGRLALVGSGSALIDTTYIDNAVSAIVAALDHAPTAHGTALVVSNGEPRTVADLFTRITEAAGAPPPRLHVPTRMAAAGGTVAETVWRWRAREDDPPMTRFLAGQLSTAHWFDQRRTRAVLHWQPEVTLDEGFARLRQWFAEHPDA